MSTRELMFDGDNRGHRTGLDAALFIVSSEGWSHETLTDDEITALSDKTADGHYDWIDEIIESATYTDLDGHTWTMRWEDGSVFAIRNDHVEDDEEIDCSPVSPSYFDGE